MNDINIISGGLLAGIDLYGDLSFKRYSMTYDQLDYIKGLVVYAGFLPYFIVRGLEGGGQLSLINSWWDAISHLMTAYVLTNYYGEVLDYNQWIGIFLVTAGGIMLKL